MLRPLLCVSLFSALALNMPASAQSAEALLVMRAMEQMGCVVNDANGEAFYAAVNLPTAALETVAEELMDAGMMRFEDDGLVLTAGACAANVPEGASAPEAMVATLIALRDNGCVITEGEVDGVLGPVGPRAEVMAHLRDLAGAGFAEINGVLGGVLGAANVCEAPDDILASFAAQVPDMLSLAPLSRRQFGAYPWTARVLYVEFLAARGCDVIAPAPLDDMPVTTGEFGPVGDILAPLGEAGVLLSPEGTSDHGLAPEYCAMVPTERRLAIAAVPDLEF